MNRNDEKVVFHCKFFERGVGGAFLMYGNITLSFPFGVYFDALMTGQNPLKALWYTIT